MLLDSNIIIYATWPEHEGLRRFIADNAPRVSAVSYVETLGYHRLGDEERQFLEAFFAAADVLPISQPVLNEAVRLRRQRRMSLGDALIAATARVHELRLVTANVEDFWWIEGLDLLNPLHA